MERGKPLTTFEDKKHRKIVVTALAAGDLPDLLAYANKLIAEDTTVLLSGAPLTNAEEQKYIRDILRLMKQGKAMRLVARIGTTIVATGDIRVGKLRKSHVGEFGISVDRQYRDSGIGTQLLSFMIEMSRHMGLRLITLTSFASNKRALHVYTSLGFIHAGTIPNALYYRKRYITEEIMYLPLM